jgi:hypothetical protein
VLAAFGCVSPKQSFQCTGNTSCRQGGETGVCEETGYCTFEDSFCSSGRRYGEASAPPYGSECFVARPPRLGPWVLGAPAGAPRHNAAVVREDNKVYVVGGNRARDTLNMTIWLATVTTGVVTWVQAGSLPELRRGLGATLFDGHLYTFGGGPIGMSTPTVLSAPIGADGSVPALTTTTPMPAPRRSIQVVASDRHAYILGGRDATSAVADILIGTMQDGMLIEWRPGGALPSPRTSFAATLYKDRIYVVGGCVTAGMGCAQPSADVEYAEIAADGTVGPFQATTPLPAARRHHALAIDGDRAFVVSGDLATGATKTVLSTHVNPDGSLGLWQPEPNTLVAERRGSVFAMDGYLVLINDDTEVAPILP